MSFSFQFSDVEDWWAHVAQTSARIADVDRALDNDTRSAVLEELAEIAAREFPDYAIPAATWVAVATA